MGVGYGEDLVVCSTLGVDMCMFLCNGCFFFFIIGMIACFPQEL
jgi:hypothetical protein